MSSDSFIMETVPSFLFGVPQILIVLQRQAVREIAQIEIPAAVASSCWRKLDVSFASASFLCSPAFRCRFFYYMLMLVLINQASITIFRCIAAIFRAVVLANVMAFVYIVRLLHHFLRVALLRCVAEPPPPPTPAMPTKYARLYACCSKQHKPEPQCHVVGHRALRCCSTASSSSRATSAAGGSGCVQTPICGAIRALQNRAAHPGAGFD